MRKQVSRDVHRLDEEVLVLDTDVNVRAEDEQLLGEVLEVLLHASIALERRDLLLRPE